MNEIRRPPPPASKSGKGANSTAQSKGNEESSSNQEELNIGSPTGKRSPQQKSKQSQKDENRTDLLKDQTLPLDRKSLEYEFGSVRFEWGSFRSIVSKHGQYTNRTDATSKFSDAFLGSPDAFISGILAPALMPGTPSPTVHQDSTLNLHWSRDLGYIVGTDLLGNPTTVVELVLRPNNAASPMFGLATFGIVGAYPK
jgi:hypothetical protein